jgi:hypothetical protein
MDSIVWAYRGFRQQYASDEAKDRGIRADAERERDNSNCREARAVSAAFARCNEGLAKTLQRIS